MPRNAERSAAAGTSPKRTSKPPPEPVLGWRDTRLFEIIQGLHVRRRDKPWYQEDTGLTAIIFLAGAVLLLAIAAMLSLRE